MLDETTYYFTAFAIDQNNNIIDSETLSITTDFWWHVTPNTLVYYNINENDTNTAIYDLSWRWNTQTWHWTATYTTDSVYWKVASFNGSSYTEASGKVNFWNEITFIALVKHSATWQQAIIAECASSSAWNIWLTVNDYLKPMWWFSGNSNWSLCVTDNDSATVWNWYMITATRDINWVAKIYINWILKDTVTLNGTPTYTSGANLQIWRWRSGWSLYLKWQFKLFIWENRTRSDSEILKFARKYWF